MTQEFARNARLQNPRGIHTSKFPISTMLSDRRSFTHPAFIVRQSYTKDAHILAQLLRPILHCLHAGYYKVGRLLMKPRPREAPHTSCSRGYSYDCYKQRRSVANVINVRKRDYLPPSVLSSLLLASRTSALDIILHVILAVIANPFRESSKAGCILFERRVEFDKYILRKQ